MKNLFPSVIHAILPIALLLSYHAVLDADIPENGLRIGPGSTFGVFCANPACVTGRQSSARAPAAKNTKIPAARKAACFKQHPQQLLGQQISRSDGLHSWQSPKLGVCPVLVCLCQGVTIPAVPRGLAGVTQINFVIPAGVATGSQPVIVTVGGVLSVAANITITP